jgi:hypothetical protein
MVVVCEAMYTVVKETRNSLVNSNHSLATLISVGISFLSPHVSFELYRQRLVSQFYLSRSAVQDAVRAMILEWCYFTPDLS